MPSPVSIEAPPTALVGWFKKELGLSGVEDWVQLTGGQSNHTYRVSVGGRDLIVRRPPNAAIDASAHSIDRELQIMEALRDTPVPVPPVVGFCDDDSILGAPFLVTGLVEGHSFRDQLPPEAPSQPDAARQIGEALIDVLVLLQGVDWRAVGLKGFGRPEGFLARQVPRWTKQYRRIQVRDLPDFDRVATWLSENEPPTSSVTVIHCDFRSDNCLIVFGEKAKVSAILDWEMATIGDPLLDLGGLLAYWGDERLQSPAMPDIQSFSRVPGAPTRHDLAQRYAERSGRSVEHLDYFMALSFWKLAAIVEGAYAQFVRGEVDTAYARGLKHDVPQLLAEAASYAGID